MRSPFDKLQRQWNDDNEYGRSSSVLTAAWLIDSVGQWTQAIAPAISTMHNAAAAAAAAGSSRRQAQGASTTSETLQQLPYLILPTSLSSPYLPLSSFFFPSPVFSGTLPHNPARRLGWDLGRRPSTLGHSRPEEHRIAKQAREAKLRTNASEKCDA